MPNPITEKKPEPDPRDADLRPHDLNRPGLEAGSFPAKAFFGLFVDRDAARLVAERLDQAGIEGEVKIWSRKSDAELLDPDKQPTGLLDRLIQMAQDLSDFKTFLAECSELVRSGRTLLLAPCEDEKTRTTCERLVKECGGAPLAYTDNWTLVKYVQTSETALPSRSRIKPG